eukprot:CAMPEP_0184712846 /NCGR_PEP_ID=MMETSP0314-20130426/3312_1 /TAXON_ID=38298 /ORGANISM="Rhodella maculata, Strain CCMP 736" /LENGTH=199 /DNA_ID=CAMNT_0027175369 /DNA_START=49 /DNA_END=648 /DNA_ORIENTATION=+
MNNTRLLTEVVIVYDADGTVMGELAYIIKKKFFGSKCAACDITHGKHAEKPDFTAFKTTALGGVPVANIHRDEMDPALQRVVGSALPAVVVRSVSTIDGGEELVLLMGQRELETCGGEVERFRELLVAMCGGIGVDVPRQGPSTGACGMPGVEVGVKQPFGMDGFGQVGYMQQDGFMGGQQQTGVFEDDENAVVPEGFY